MSGDKKAITGEALKAYLESITKDSDFYYYDEQGQLMIYTGLFKWKDGKYRFSAETE